MQIILDHSIALAIVAFAWITKIGPEPKQASLVGWVVGGLITVLLLVGVFAR